MATKILINEGDVFYPKAVDFARHTHRRIVGIVGGGRVFYSTGGEKVHSCKPKQLLRWGARDNAPAAE